MKFHPNSTHNPTSSNALSIKYIMLVWWKGGICFAKINSTCTVEKWALCNQFEVNLASCDPIIQLIIYICCCYDSQRTASRF